jgi:hypothetical protein
MEYLFAVEQEPEEDEDYNDESPEKRAGEKEHPGGSCS